MVKREGLIMNEVQEWLMNYKGPWIGISPASKEDATLQPEHLVNFDKNAIVRKLRGKKMVTMEDLMSEFAAALQFFDGFGENWYALKDCLCSLDEWLPCQQYVLVINEGQRVLEQDAENYKWFLKTLNEVGEWWAKPIENNDRFNRKAIPFHTLFKCDQDKVENIESKLVKLKVEYFRG
jgi:hypothetical protein